MDVDVNANLKAKEHISSPPRNDLSTQEVQEVIVDLFGSLEDPLGGHVIYASHFVHTYTHH